jgi:hypothetical protein
MPRSSSMMVYNKGPLMRLFSTIARALWNRGVWTTESKRAVKVQQRLGEPCRSAEEAQARKRKLEEEERRRREAVSITQYSIVNLKLTSGNAGSR